MASNSQDKINDFLVKVLTNPIFYIGNFLKIQPEDTDRGIIPLRVNFSQKKLMAVIRWHWINKKPVRIIILKARRQGMSTFTEAIMFWITATRNLIRTLIMSQDDESTATIFDMSKLFYDNLPLSLRPMIKAQNKKELRFENPTKNIEEKQKNPGLRSRIQVMTAGKEEPGRGMGISLFHASEVAFWKNAGRIMLAVLQTVPKTLKSMVIIESTANGRGGYFYDMWQGAKNGSNDFFPLFLPWFIHNEYRMAVPEDFQLTEKEQWLKSIYKLDDDQIVWRRWCIRNNCGGSERKFRQEYPANDNEAFLLSGRPRFEVESLEWYLANAQLKTQLTGEIVHGIGAMKNNNGNMKFFQKYDQRKQYVVFSDVSEGITADDKNEDPDYSCAKVLDLHTGEQVAEWHGRLDHREYGKVLVNIGRHYNNAVLVIEANNHGHSVITKVIDEKYPEELIFQTTHQKEKSDDKFKKPAKRFGWMTTSHTRKIIIDVLASKLLNQDIPGISKDDWGELSTFVVNAKGKAEADKGCHDDRVMTLAIAYYVINFVEFIAFKDFQSCSSCRYCQPAKNHITGEESMACTQSNAYVSQNRICRLYQQINLEDEPFYDSSKYESTAGYIPINSEK